MAKCIIMSAGDFIPEELHKEAGDIVIAADDGLSHLSRIGVVPDYIIGDYDSLEIGEGAVLSAFRAAHPERERHLPKEKDDTDTMAAARWGLELGFTDFLFYGALGGSRMDHTIANLQTLLFLAGNGARGIIVDAGQELFLIRNEVRTFPLGSTGGFSLFAADPVVRVTIRGMKYECEDLSLTYDFPIGCSNEFIPEKEAEVCVAGGTALAVVQRQKRTT